MNAEKIEVGDRVFYANGIYEVAEIKDFPHGVMVGIYDEPPSKHVDYIKPESLLSIAHCYNCQGGGCPVCGGFGFLIGLD